jgi:hypothetical protein
VTLKGTLPLPHAEKYITYRFLKGFSSKNHHALGIENAERSRGVGFSVPY